MLGSGSKGNCTFIESGRTRILFDGGFSGADTARRLAAIGVDPHSLSAILVTHEHGDHVRGVGVLSRKYKLMVHANDATFKAAGRELTKLHGRQHFGAGETFFLQDLKIHPFAISHDAADPVGFIVEDQAVKIGYCTDTGSISKLMQHRLSGCHSLVLESNHDPDLLRNGPYPPALQQRVRSNKGHLANLEAARFLKAIAHAGLGHVVLAHLSETNNRPALALDVVTNELYGGLNGHPWPRVSLAGQERVGEVVHVGGGDGR